jgi:hypothetical protein
MPALVVGIIGALGGGLISMLTSLLTLRSSHRAERTRWVDDRGWEHLSGLSNARRDAYARFLCQQNAMIMVVGSTIDNVQQNHNAFHQMPPDQTAAYQSLQDAYAQSLLLAGSTVQNLLIEYQNYLDQLVRASWQGDFLQARDGLYTDLLTAMQKEAVESPQLSAVVQE